MAAIARSPPVTVTSSGMRGSFPLSVSGPGARPGRSPLWVRSRRLADVVQAQLLGPGRVAALEGGELFLPVVAVEALQQAGARDARLPGPVDDDRRAELRVVGEVAQQLPARAAG